MKRKIYFFFLCLILIPSLFGEQTKSRDCGLSFAEEEKNGHALIVCDNGLEMFHWDLKFLSEAQKSVEILACFFGGTIARQLLNAIEDRLKQVPELQVFLLASPTLIEKKDWDLIFHLQCLYPDRFHMELCTQIAKLLPDVTTIDNHVKMFIVDERYFSAGGTNLEECFCSDGSYTPESTHSKNFNVDYLLPSAMRDLDVVGRGPLARELREAFFKLYAVWEYYNISLRFEPDPEKFKDASRYCPLNETLFIEQFEISSRKIDLDAHQAKTVLGGPHQKCSSITKEYINLIQEAQEEIILANLYFFPDESIITALLDAVNRGVRLIVLTNGISEISPKFTTLFAWGSRLSYATLFYGCHFHLWDAWSISTLPLKNTKIYEYYVKDVLLHKKMMIVDNKIFLVGSYNFSLKSAHGDYELVLVFRSEEMAKSARAIHEKDLDLSQEISPSQACQWYFNPLIHYWGELQKKFNGFL